VSVFAQWQPFVDGTYTCSGGRSALGFDSTIVRVNTDDGVVGWGEMAPLGSFYDPSFVGGAREGIRISAPLMIGRDPRHHLASNRARLTPPTRAQIDTAAIAHLSLSTPPSSRTHTVDFHNWVTAANGTGDLLCEGGTMSAPTGPGLGIDVDLHVLGQPLFVTGT
jgi:L-alanine-DL-glutamate epimerase-like enolase superfamily enzyme